MSDMIKQAFDEFDKWDNALAKEITEEEWDILSPVVKAYLYGREGGLKNDYENELAEEKETSDSLSETLSLCNVDNARLNELLSEANEVIRKATNGIHTDSHVAEWLYDYLEKHNL